MWRSLKYSSLCAWNAPWCLQTSRNRAADCSDIYSKTLRPEIQQPACLKHRGRAGRSCPSVRNPKVVILDRKMELVIPVLFVVGLSENQRKFDACNVRVLYLGSLCTFDRSSQCFRERALCWAACQWLLTASFYIHLTCSLLNPHVCFLPAQCRQSWDTGSSWESSMNARHHPGLRALWGLFLATAVWNTLCWSEGRHQKNLWHIWAVLSAHPDWISKRRDRIWCFSSNTLWFCVSALQLKTNMGGRGVCLWFSAWQCTC